MSTIITDRPYYPSLLLSPGKSRDRNGPVALTESGAVRRVPFDGGQAFFVEEDTTNLIPNPSFEIDLSGWTWTGSSAVTIVRDATQSTDGTTSLRVGVNGTNPEQGAIMAPNQVEISPATTYTLSAFVKAPPGLGLELGGTLWNGGTYAGHFSPKAFVGTGLWERVVNTQTVASAPLNTMRPFVHMPSSGYPRTFWVDGVQVEQKSYATSFTHGDMGDGYSWTGAPHESVSVRELASISTPLDTFSTAYIRHDGGSIFLTEPGTFGEYGLLTLDNGTLTVSTDRETTIAALVLYDTTLTGAEIARLDSIPTSELTWANIGSQVLRPQETEISVGEPPPGANRVEMAVYETDRDNVSREPLAYITDATPDWDIDRAGSKGRVRIASHRRVLRDGMWVATHIRIVQEVGDIIDMQTGHFRLDVPSAEFDGSVGMDGGEKVLQNAVGSDIVDLLAKAQLPYTFYTPVGGHVMSDVQNLIQIGTMGRLGPNLLTNGSFENGTTGWSTTAFELGAVGQVQSSIPQFGGAAPDGEHLYAILLNSGLPAGARTFTRQELNSLPPWGTMIVLSAQGFVFNQREHLEARVTFYDGPNATGSQLLSRSLLWYYPGQHQWERKMLIMSAPDGAASARVYLWIFRDDAGAPSSRSAFDDVQLRTITNASIPASRINLPPSDATATTRIQTTGGASIGTVAINADRLAAISHHAINATAEGVLTTYPSRSLGDGTAARTYGLGDYRFRGSKRIEPGPNNRFSMVTAVKESFEEGVAPLVVTVWNDDYDDPWSVHKIGNVGKEIMVQDAVDEDALEAAARAELARSTMQEELVIRVAPDPELTVYDVIEIEGGPEELQGRWLVQALSGVTPQAPYTEIHARRSRTSVGVTHG